MGKPFDLDRLITLEDCALWLGIGVPQLRDRVEKNQIPAVTVAGGELGFHPRQVIRALYKPTPG